MGASIIKIKPKQGSCLHKHIIIDLDMRKLECEACGADVDPIDWIHKVGVEEQILDTRLNSLKIEVANLQKQKVDLKAKLNIKPQPGY